MGTGKDWVRFSGCFGGCRFWDESRARHEFGSARLPNYNEGMVFDDYKLVIYRNQPDGWVAEIPAIAGCHALMPTVAEAVSELDKVFHLIEEEYRAAGQALPQDTTEIVHA